MHCISIQAVNHCSVSYLPQTPQLFAQLSIIQEFVSHSPLMAPLGQLIRSVSLQLTAKQRKRHLLSLIRKAKQEHETA